MAKFNVVELKIKNGKLLDFDIKSEKEKKALIQTTLTLTRAQDFFQTPNVLGSQMVA